MAKSILGICYSLDTGSIKAQENLELIMLYASYGFKVSLALMDQAVISAQAEQDFKLINRKTISNLYQALEMYDVSGFYLETEAIEKYQVQLDPVLEFKSIDRMQLHELMKQADEVLIL